MARGYRRKLDLLVSLDFRMTATPLYSDIVLPAATWYEKHDLSSQTCIHLFIHLTQRLTHYGNRVRTRIFIKL